MKSCRRFPFNTIEPDGHTFTQLWFDDLHSAQPQRLLELKEGDSLSSGRYLIVNKICTGGLAKIYRGFDTIENMEVAIKEIVLPTGGGAQIRQKSFARAKSEAALLAKFDHPGIVKLKDNFVEDHRAYLILEHAEGKTLRALIRDHGRLPWIDVCRIGIEICLILDYLHGLELPVIHRDLTPDNLICDSQLRIKLLDFNVAKQQDGLSSKTVVGKQSYMAPEQFRGQPAPQSDLYSLGCTLYYLLVAVDPKPIAVSHPAEKNIELPQALDLIVARLTAANLNERYQTAAEVKIELEKLVEIFSSAR